ncbi:hypothetical protein AB6A40_008018 [Gnathostoma spinigerum]|uniref:Elongation of very long chain fatty acids protein n=1 Tax=Gnathostoma spinigerum TaxID=75299 RepID=A0ABD6ET14_9BILA
MDLPHPAKTSDAQQFFDILLSREFPEQSARDWIEVHQISSIKLAIAYAFVVFSLKYFMRTRKPLNLDFLLSSWNLLLSVFSIIGTINLAPEFFSTIAAKGFQASYCRSLEFTKGRVGYWVWLFIVSKTFELFDTVFVVLRKKPLLFLHWYHHILTLIYAFYSYPSAPGFNRWGIFLNFTVHSFMYSYYLLRSLKLRIPGSFARFVTTLQIVQFVISVAILIHLGVLIHIQNVNCDFSGGVYMLAVFMDVTYLILFVNFFLKSYIVEGGKRKYSNKKMN